MLIFCDIDEVLADFAGAACQLFGITHREFEQRQPPGVWGMEHGLGITIQEFYDRVEQCDMFWWGTLKRTPWALDMLGLLDHYCYGDWLLVTSPKQFTQFPAGRRFWIGVHYGSKFDRYIFTNHKHLLAMPCRTPSTISPCRVLIDDSEEAINEWNKRGGVGILFPSIFNSLHALRTDPIPYVMEKLRDASDIH